MDLEQPAIRADRLALKLASAKARIHKLKRERETLRVEVDKLRGQLTLLMQTVEACQLDACRCDCHAAAPPAPLVDPLAD